MNIIEITECEIIPEGVSTKLALSYRGFAFRRGQQLIKVKVPSGPGPITVEEITLPTDEEMNKLYRGEA